MKLLGDLLEKRGKDKQKSALDEKTLFFIISKVLALQFGEAGKQNIFPIKIIEKTLVLKTSGSLWSSEVWLRRSSLIKAINQEIGTQMIEKIKI